MLKERKRLVNLLGHAPEQSTTEPGLSDFRTPEPHPVEACCSCCQFLPLECDSAMQRRWPGSVENDLSGAVVELLIRDLIVNHWMPGRGFPQVTTIEADDGYQVFLTLNGRSARPLAFSREEAVEAADRFRGFNLQRERRRPKTGIMARMPEVRERLFELGK